MAIVGAGVCGLSVAYLLAKEGGYDVTVFAEHISPNTCSDASAAILWKNFIGRLALDSNDPDASKEKRWLEVTFKHFCDVIHSGGEQKSGVNFASGYVVDLDDHDVGSYKRDQTEEIETQFNKSTIGLRAVPNWEADLYNLPPSHPAMFATTIVLDCRIYLPWLMQKFLSSGGRFIQKKISSFDDLQRDYHVVVNCTGLGSRELVPDSSLYPVYGQCVSVEAPWIKQFVFIPNLSQNEYTAILPRVNDVVLGGVVLPKYDSKEVSPAIREQIVSRAVKIAPSLAGAKVLGEWSGLRPCRDKIRLEVEHTPRGPIIHNYGHGGNGVNYSWGCAESVHELLQELDSTHQWSKL